MEVSSPPVLSTAPSSMKEVKINGLTYISFFKGREFKVFLADYGDLYGMVGYRLSEEVDPESIGPNPELTPLPGFRFTSETFLADVSTIPVIF